MNLFGSRSSNPKPAAAAPATTAQSIMKIKETITTLEKREEHLEKKIQLQLAEARQKSAAQDKRGALFCLKRKKMMEAEVSRIQGAQMTLETQIDAMSTQQTNIEVVDALKISKANLKRMQQAVYVHLPPCVVNVRHALM